MKSFDREMLLGTKINNIVIDQENEYFQLVENVLWRKRQEDLSG